MKTTQDCIPCFVRQAAEAVEMSAIDSRRKAQLLKRLLHEIADADWDVMPVSIAQRVQRLVRTENGQTDPYRPLKDRMKRRWRRVLTGGGQKRGQTVPVYVDKQRNAFRGMVLCHMLADSEDELHNMARQVRMKREWFQNSRVPHYDICMERRAMALAKGAIEIDRGRTVQLMRKHGWGGSRCGRGHDNRHVENAPGNENADIHGGKDLL